MSEDIVIKVDDVSKDFVLPHEKVDTVKGMFTSLTKGKLWKEKETQHALRNISFEIKKGEFFGIVGRNGSGKSTLLKILAGIYQPTKGKVTTTGKIVPFIELGVGFNGELTGRENVYLNGAMLGFSRKQMDKMYKPIVEFAELERFMDQKLKNYSSGMQVRLAFSLATRAEADILLVDEVLAVGDADFQRKCFDYFRKLKKNKKTVIFVSHDMGAVRSYCDRAILIEENRLVFAGTSDKVASEYTRMFSEDLNVEVSTNNKKRWGNKKVSFTKVKITPEKVSSKKGELKLEAQIHAKEDMEDIVVGFSIKNATGHDVLGTNTRIYKMNTGTWKKGVTKTVSWAIPNLFSDGNYSIDVAALELDASTVCDWWEGAGDFVVFEETPTGYLVNPEITIKVSGGK